MLLLSSNTKWCVLTIINVHVTRVSYLNLHVRGSASQWHNCSLQTELVTFAFLIVFSCIKYANVLCTNEIAPSSLFAMLISPY